MNDKNEMCAQRKSFAFYSSFKDAIGDMSDRFRIFRNRANRINTYRPPCVETYPPSTRSLDETIRYER